MFSLPKVFLHTHNMNAACLSRQCNYTRQSESTTQPTKMWGDLQPENLARDTVVAKLLEACLGHFCEAKKQTFSESTTFEIMAHPDVLAKQKTPKHLSSLAWLWHCPCVWLLSSVQKTSYMIHIVPSHIESQDGDGQFWMGFRASAKSNYPSQATR